jgi:hypothetical protein
MNRTTIRISGIMVILVVSLIISSGCLNYEIPAGPTGPEETTTGVTAAPTAAAGDVMQQGATPGEQEVFFESQGYIQRPWGYAAAERDPSHTLSVLESRIESDDEGGQYITGRLKNDQNTRIEYAVVTFNLYDANANHIGNVYAKTDYLGGGKVWIFRTNSFNLKNYQFFEVADIFTT